MCLGIFLLLCLVISPTVLAEEKPQSKKQGAYPIHLWIDSSGKHKLEAKYIQMEKQYIHLLGKDKINYHIHFNSLCLSDKELIRKYLHVSLSEMAKLQRMWNIQEEIDAGQRLENIARAEQREKLYDVIRKEIKEMKAKGYPPNKIPKQPPGDSTKIKTSQKPFSPFIPFLPEEKIRYIKKGRKQKI